MTEATTDQKKSPTVTYRLVVAAKAVLSNAMRRFATSQPADLDASGIQIDSKRSPGARRKTFSRALLQGISSVGTIYTQPAPTIKQPGSIESDLEKIGGDFRRAIGYFEIQQEAQESDKGPKTS